MFSTSHLPPSTLRASTPVSLTHTHYFSVRLSLSCSLLFCLSISHLNFLFFCFSLVAFFCPLFSVFYSVSCSTEWTHTHAHRDRRVVESERVSVLFSGQLGLIFSTFCFRTLTDSLQGETERNTHTHKRRTHSGNRDITVCSLHSEVSSWWQACTHTGSGKNGQKKNTFLSTCCRQPELFPFFFGISAFSFKSKISLQFQLQSSTFRSVSSAVFSLVGAIFLTQQKDPFLQLIYSFLLACHKFLSGVLAEVRLYSILLSAVSPSACYPL